MIQMSMIFAVLLSTSCLLLNSRSCCFVEAFSAVDLKAPKLRDFSAKGHHGVASPRRWTRTGVMPSCHAQSSSSAFLPTNRRFATRIVPVPAAPQKSGSVPTSSVVMFATATTMNDNDADPAPDDLYDLIVIGSGNGACAFLSHALDHADDDAKILVLEEGVNFFLTGDFTHENNWSKTYSTGQIFKLNNVLTPSNTPVISGRACTMGGGGSINYTMIHESNKWLMKHLGRTEEYWQRLKEELNEKFNRTDPAETDTEFSKYIQRKAHDVAEYKYPNPAYLTKNIPTYHDVTGGEENANSKQLYIFPTQFNEFGQRVHSGVSLVDWQNERLCLKTRRVVSNFRFDDGTPGSCTVVEVKNLETGRDETYRLNVKGGGKLIMCCGSQSPRMLLPHRDKLENPEIGKYVNDHICMPLAIYLVPKEERVGPKDNYESLFAMSVLKDPVGTEVGGDGEEGGTVCNFDFFSGRVERLVYLISSLYLAYIPFNAFKRWMIRTPWSFTLLSNTIRVILEALVGVYNVLTGLWDVIRGKPWGTSQVAITTSLLKFNSAREGQYEIDSDDDQITLGFFEDDKDFRIAEKAINDNLEFLESIGPKLCIPLRWIFSWITKIPYKKGRAVERYVRHFSKRTLLSEQHTAGGCLIGKDKAADPGEDERSKTGLVYGTDNIHVADLSAVSLPRVSTQMTAYLVGFHVAKQLYPDE